MCGGCFAIITSNSQRRSWTRLTSRKHLRRIITITYEFLVCCSTSGAFGVCTCLWRFECFFLTCFVCLVGGGWQRCPGKIFTRYVIVDTYDHPFSMNTSKSHQFIFSHSFPLDFYGNSGIDLVSYCVAFCGYSSLAQRYCIPLGRHQIIMLMGWTSN